MPLGWDSVCRSPGGARAQWLAAGSGTCAHRLLTARPHPPSAAPASSALPCLPSPGSLPASMTTIHVQRERLSRHQGVICLPYQVPLQSKSSQGCAQERGSFEHQLTINTQHAPCFRISCEGS